ncbi:hydrogenase maturation nickel metallochaperone HypA [Consotaella aegiceratis]|uniref:hydrogenase maturation nickel metallochaperone HypA/HybF n=1 Tax=Consotaella aegiceratis TaxID=3097961 RepID=UPI003D8051FD
MRILSQKAAENGIRRIVSIQLKIGRLRGLDVRQVRGCFELFAEGTAAEGARLDIDEVGVEALCRTCGQIWQVEGYRMECPSCGAGNAEIRSGRELYIETFEGERSSEPTL